MKLILKHFLNEKAIKEFMNKKNYTLFEYKSIYALQDVIEPYYDGNNNLVVPENLFKYIENFYYANNDVQQYFMPSKKNGKKALTAKNYVGVIQTKDGTTIEILPKISSLQDDEKTEENQKPKTKEDKSKDILIKMLKTLKKSPFKNLNTANLRSTNLPLLEIFITMFLEELAGLIQKGIKSDYITKQENLKFLKGKLIISQQIKQNYIHKERFFVEYQEFSSNRIENILIKTTLEYLYKKTKLNNNKKRIREFLFVFDEIKVSHNIKNDFEKVNISRQMKDYEQVLLWCKTFLLGNSFSPYKGNDIAFALLFDMNLLFESYVGNYLKKRISDIKLQDKTHHLAYLDNINKFQLKPDIVINDGKIIADTKWKLLSEDKTHQGISQADMYQLYAYGTKYKECNYMYLIYPKDSELNGNSYKYFKNEDKELHLNILFFDITKDIPEFVYNDYTNLKDYQLYNLIKNI